MGDFWRPGMTLEDVDKAAILDAFRFFQGNKTRTAKGLNIAIRTLDAKLAMYLPKEEKKDGRNPAIAPKTDANRAVFESVAASQRVHLESAPKISEEQPVPVREQKEVQKVLPEQSSKGHSKPGKIQRGT
jgi:Bacterial regulatory protein, Fis family